MQWIEDIVYYKWIARTLMTQDILFCSLPMLLSTLILCQKIDVKSDHFLRWKRIGKCFSCYRMGTLIKVESVCVMYNMVSMLGTDGTSTALAGDSWRCATQLCRTDTQTSTQTEESLVRTLICGTPHSLFSVIPSPHSPHCLCDYRNTRYSFCRYSNDSFVRQLASQCWGRAEDLVLSSNDYQQ